MVYRRGLFVMKNWSTIPNREFTLADIVQGDRVELRNGQFAEVITVKFSSLVVRCDGERATVRVYLDDLWRLMTNRSLREKIFVDITNKGESHTMSYVIS